jgi:SAM-dependent methyltransferase
MRFPVEHRYPFSMGHAEWGAYPEFFGPRHAHREGRIARELERRVPGPCLHLECAAGVGSLSSTLAERGHSVVAADSSLRSLAHLRQRSQDSGIPVYPVVADILALPFADATFASASSAETLEHLDEDRAAACELGRVLEFGGWLVGTVPADPTLWSDWDEWAGHLRRYTSEALAVVLREVGPRPEITSWGWPLVRLYDALFLGPVNRSRLRGELGPGRDPKLRRVAAAGRRKWLVCAVQSIFEIDRLFDGVGRGGGWIFAVRRGS